MTKKITLFLMLALAAYTGLMAQLNVGSSSAPNANAILEMTSTNKGMLLPRIQLDSMNSPAPLNAYVAGMMVFNIAAKGSGAKAVTANTVYVSDGNKWNPLTFNNSFSQATFTGSTINCSGTLSGIYQQGVAMSGGNTKVITITTANAGTYTATTDTKNGVSFSASGTLLSAGAGTQVTLNASGTPASGGTFTYTASLGGQSCTFDVTFNAAATFACGTATHTQSPASGPLQPTPGNYTGTHVVSYTAGNGQAYPAYSQTQSGLTLSAPAGTYLPGGGTITYTLSGTYTGPANGTVAFTGTVCGSVVFGDAIRAALTVSASKYDTAATGNWVAITAGEYANLANTGYIQGAGKYILTDAQMADQAPSTFYVDATVSAGTALPQLPAASYVYAATIRFSANGGTGTFSDRIKINTQNSTTAGTFTNLGNSFTLSSATLSTQFYLVLKGAGQTTYSGGASTVALYQSGNVPVRNVNVYGNMTQGDVNTLAPNYPYAPSIQVLGTTSRQW